MTIELAVLAALLLISAFFSSSETSLFSLDRFDMERLRREGHPRLPIIERLLGQPRRLIVTILIGNELANVAATVISAGIVIELLGVERRWVNLLVMVPLLLLVGEITPKTLAIRNNVRFAGAQAPFIEAFARVIGPLRWAVRQVADFFTTLIVGRERSRASIVTEDMVRSIAEEAVGEGALDRREAHYINQILRLGDQTLREVMTPRSQIVLVDDDLEPAVVVETVLESGHSRVPVRHSEAEEETFVGVLYGRDLLGVERALLAETDLQALLREPWFVPETKRVAELFRDFRKRRLSMALTVDEFGGVTGLVTTEDLLECIFGEIPSRSDRDIDELVQPLEVGRWLAAAPVTLEALSERLNLTLVAEESETLGGMLLERFGEVPSEGAQIEIEGVRFMVETVEAHRITRVLIEVAG